MVEYDQYISLLGKWAEKAGMVDKLTDEIDSLRGQVDAANKGNTISFWVGVMAAVGVAMVIWTLGSTT